MVLSSTHFGSGGSCILRYEEAEQWLHATWSGLIGDYEARQGAHRYLDKVAAHPSPFLLNDNLAMHGPWFNSVEWLEHAWLPQAERLGLRYIAHVVQADRGADVLTLTKADHLSGVLDLQLFYDLDAAKDWLHSCQQQAGGRHRAAPAASSQPARGNQRSGYAA